MQYAHVNNKFVFWICVFVSFFLFFSLFSDVCFPFICGFILAYIFAPFINFLSKYKYMNRSFLSLIFAVGTVLIFILGVVVLLPHIRDYLTFLNGKIPEYYSLFVSFMNDAFSFINISEVDIASAKAEIQKFLDQKVYVLASIIEGVASKGKEISHFFSFFIIMPISLFYFLKDWNRMSDFIFSCVPIQHRRTLLEISYIIRRTVRNFLYWQFYIVFTLFAYYAATLRFVSVDNSMYLAIASGLFSFIPFIGCLFSCFLVIFVSIPVMTLSKFYLIVAIYFIGQFIEGYILYPHFVGKKTGLHPLWILFSFFAGVELKGIIGVLIAIPSAAVVRSLCSYAIRKFKATQTYKQRY